MHCEIFADFFSGFGHFIISVTLGAHNDQVITFNYLLAQGDFRISTLLATLFGVGFLLGWVICGLFWLRVRVSLANAQRKLNVCRLRLIRMRLAQVVNRCRQPCRNKIPC